jgi:hypothetical protein
MTLSDTMNKISNMRKKLDVFTRDMVFSLAIKVKGSRQRFQKHLMFQVQLLLVQ